MAIRYCYQHYVAIATVYRYIISYNYSRAPCNKVMGPVLPLHSLFLLPNICYPMDVSTACMILYEIIYVCV